MIIVNEEIKEENKPGIYNSEVVLSNNIVYRAYMCFSFSFIVDVQKSVLHKKIMQKHIYARYTILLLSTRIYASI